MDSKYCQYLYDNYHKSVVGIWGIDINNEIHMYIRYKNKHKWKCMAGPGIGTLASLVRCSTTELSRPISFQCPCSPKYHIPPLTKFLPLKKTHNKHKFNLSRFIDLANVWSKMVTEPNVTEKRWNIETINFYT